MSKIFISYKRVDIARVLEIKNQIESALGEKCWIDIDGIESDAQFKNVIIKAINECDIVLFMYSKAHSEIVDFEKDWTARELNFAQKKGKRIVFVNLDGSPLTDAFEFDYGTKQQVDSSSNQAMSHLINDLAIWLKMIIAEKDKENGKIEYRSKIPSFSSWHQHKWQIILCGLILTSIIIYVILILFSMQHNVKKLNINGSILRMIQVDSGNFQLGHESPDGDFDTDEYPSIPVFVNSFYMSETEVTYDLWNKVMAGTIYEIKGNNNDKPVSNVSYLDICVFIDSLNAKFSGKKDAYKFRLPTEIEWEYAAKGGPKSVGCTYAGGEKPEDIGWYELNSRSMSHTVASKEPNELGLYDMSGNVWELCSNEYFNYADYNGVIKEVSINNPKNVCIRRGGSWQDACYCLRTTYRSKQRIDERKINVGFRLVLCQQ